MRMKLLGHQKLREKRQQLSHSSPAATKKSENEKREDEAAQCDTEKMKTFPV